MPSHTSLVPRRGPPFWGVVAFALLARGAFVAFVLGPLAWDNYGIDHGSELGSIARNVFESRGFSSPFEPGDAPTAWLAPLVPLIWVAVFKVFGLFTQASFFVILALQMFAGALACGFYVKIGAWSLERMQVKRAGAWLWLLALVVCVWPEALDRQTHMWYFAYQELALAWMFLEGLRWLETPDRKRGIRLGIAAGVLAAIQPGPLPVFAAFVVIALFRQRRVLAPAAISVGVCTLLLVPWTVRNFVVFGELVPLRSNLGVELLQGNGERGAVFQDHTSQHPAIDARERARYDELGELAYERAARAEALEHIRADPALFALRTSQRVAAYWLSDFLDRWPWTPRLPWWENGATAIARRSIKLACIWAPLAVIVVCLIRGRRFPGLSAYVALWLLVPLPYYITHIHEAYAYTVRPYLVVGALLLLAACQTRLSEPRAARAAITTTAH